MDVPRSVPLMGRWRRLGSWLLVGLCLYWFLPTWILHIRRTFDPFTFNDDARILIWPFLRQADPALFPNDPFVDYYLSGLPEGFLALYRIVGRLGYAKVTSEILQYVSVLSVAGFLGLSARRLGGPLAAFLTTVIVLGSEPFFDRAGGGLPRAFAFPLISAGLYALVLGRPMALALLAIAGAAFYPVVAALLGLSLFLLLVLPGHWRQTSSDQQRSLASPQDSVKMPRNGPWTSLRSRALLLLGTMICLVVLVVPMDMRLRAYGDVITPAMLPDFPEAALGGRLTPEQHPPYESFARAFARHAQLTLVGSGEPIGRRLATWLRAEDKRTKGFLVLTIALAAIQAVWRARRRPELLRPWLLLMAAILGHALASMVAPRLFLPERYVQYSVPPSLALLVGVGFGSARPAETPSRHRLALQIVAVALIVGILGGRGTSWVGIEVYVPPGERPMYSAFSRLPRNSVIAGWPVGPTENVPYLSGRRVLSNFQLEMPFHSKFTLESRARLAAFFEAYFATSPDPIRRLCTKFHVTHLLYDPSHFSGEAPDYYAPYRRMVAHHHRLAREADPLLVQLSTRAGTQHFAGGLALVDLARIPELAPACAMGPVQ